MINYGYSYSDFLRGVNSNFPLVGITFEQAENFCKWRSDRVEEKFKMKVIYSIPNVDDYKLYNKFIISKRDSKKDLDLKYCEYTSDKKFIFCEGIVKELSSGY